MAGGAPGLQFRSLILHLYQTPGGKQAKNWHDVSNPSLRFIPCVLLWSIANSINAINRHLRLSIHLLSIWPFHHAKAAPLKNSSKGSPRQLWFKDLHIRDPLCIRSVPLNPAVPHSGTLLCFDSHIVPVSYGSNEARPVSCLMFNSLCGSDGAAQKLLGSKNQNTDENKRATRCKYTSDTRLMSWERIRLKIEGSLVWSLAT